MKLKNKKHKNFNLQAIRNEIETIEQYAVFFYLFCMFGIFPLHYKEQYYKIGTAKFDFFWNVSLYFIISTAVFIVIKAVIIKIGNLKKEKFLRIKEEKAQNLVEKYLNKLSVLDFTVLVYGICVVLSYSFSDYKDYAFKGAVGWEMGLCSQLIFVALYFLLSGQKMFRDLFPLKKIKGTSAYFLEKKRIAILLLGVHLTASALTFFFGILHRFDIDPLGMYEGLTIDQKREFLSTMGQATWYSSYVCTTFAIGITIFYISKHKWVRLITGIYTVISFGILVTQNSDSAFMAIAGIILLLGYFSIQNRETWCRFWQLLCLMLGTFMGVGMLQKLYADRIIPLDDLSLFFSQSPVILILFGISLGILCFYRKYENKEKEEINKLMQYTKAGYVSFLVLLAASVILMIVFIYLNTKGYLLSWFGYQSTHPYLLFDYHWGSNRGSTWLICTQAFMDLPWYQKLFGVGPDSLSQYLYSVPEIEGILRSLWGNVNLTNAHNEYLNSLLCYGVVGVVSWIAVLFGGMRYFYEKAKENSFMIAFALCIAGYACHNIFCYQQVCCTPFLFILLGVGESLTKSENFNTIK